MSPHLEMDRYNRNLFFIFSFGLCYNWLRGLYFIEESKSVPAEILSGERSLVETRSCPEFMGLFTIRHASYILAWGFSYRLVLNFTPGSLQDLRY